MKSYTLSLTLGKEFYHEQNDCNIITSIRTIIIHHDLWGGFFLTFMYASISIKEKCVLVLVQGKKCKEILYIRIAPGIFRIKSVQIYFSCSPEILFPSKLT